MPNHNEIGRYRWFKGWAYTGGASLFTPFSVESFSAPRLANGDYWERDRPKVLPRCDTVAPFRAGGQMLLVKGGLSLP